MAVTRSLLRGIALRALSAKPFASLNFPIVPSISSSPTVIQSPAYFSSPERLKCLPTISRAFHIPFAAAPSLVPLHSAFVGPLSSTARALHGTRQGRSGEQLLPLASSLSRFIQQTRNLSKVKAYKMKPYSSYKDRFKLMADGTYKRWRSGTRHNAHSKTPKQRRQLRRPSIAPAALGRVMKKLNFH